MKECLALIQSHNFSSIEDSLKQAGDTEENTKLATRILGKGYIKNCVGAAVGQTVSPHLFVSHVSN